MDDDDEDDEPVNSENSVMDSTIAVDTATPETSEKPHLQKAGNRDR